MHPDPETGTIIYRSGMNAKIRLQLPFASLTPARSCRLSPFVRLEIFTPCDFIAAITQHIPDKSFQLVRYYGWYSNKMRGQRNKQDESGEGEPLGNGIEI
ncbi:MAG: transposase, partial [Kiritimatiellaceae bacterium]|nr:transposase [Kiritimatiellaceae bacterium]